MGGRWVTDGYRWAWQCNNGAYLRNGWYLIDGRYYYFDGSGYMRPAGCAVGVPGTTWQQRCHADRRQDRWSVGTTQFRRCGCWYPHD